MRTKVRTYQGRMPAPLLASGSSVRTKVRTYQSGMPARPPASVNPQRMSVRTAPGRRAKSPANPRKKPAEKSELRFTETLSAATILVPQAFSPDTGETDEKPVARVDTAEMAMFLSIPCCNATRPCEPLLKPPIPAPHRCVRFSCSYLLASPQVRDEPACKQTTHTGTRSETRTHPGAGFFISGPGFTRNHSAIQPRPCIPPPAKPGPAPPRPAVVAVAVRCAAPPPPFSPDRPVRRFDCRPSFFFPAKEPPP